MENNKRKSVIVLTGPSQVGKTIGKEFLISALGLETIPSYTTREPFPNEVNGQDYHFVDDTEFNALKEKNHFLETSDHYGASYGTARDSYYEAIGSNRPVVVAINVDGAKSFKEEFGEDCVTIFIAPPNPAVWMERVKANRSGNDDRVSAFSEEMEQKDTFDYLIVNDDLNNYYRALGVLVRDLIK